MNSKPIALLFLVTFSLGIVFNLDYQYFAGPACDPAMSDQELAGSRHISIETLNKLRIARGLINEEICSFADKKLAKAIAKANHPKPDHPDEAIAFRNLQLQDENKFIPADGLSKAASHVKAMRDFQSRANSGSITPSLAGISSGSWTSIGPGNIGGRVRALVIHPGSPDTMWLGSVGGGIWKTTNGGTSWTPLDDFMANLAVSTLIIDPANPNILYAGTGEGFYNGDGLRGAGIYKTTDGGTTWNQLANTANSNFYYVNRLAISPDSGTILAATRTGIWRSLDAGATWTQESALNNFLDIDFNPTDSMKAVAGGFNGMAYYSIDGGNSWTQSTGITKASNGYQRIELAYAPSNGSIVYASDWYADTPVSKIWKSTDGGATYVNNNASGTFLGSQGWYDNIIWVDPTNAATIIVGGIDLWRSFNEGLTPLTKISQWFSAPSSAHADHHNIVAHPNFDGTTNKTVFFTNDGGIYKTSDVYAVAPTTGWTELNNNLAITQFYGGAGHAASGNVVGGAQDNGTLYYTGNAEAWTSPFGGDGGWSAYDPVDQNYFYGEYVYLQIHRNTTGGASSSSYIYSGIGDAGSNANFIAPFILDPNNANTMLAGGRDLWRSVNVKAGTPSWTSIKATVGSNISAISVAPGNSDIIWVGHNNGLVYKTVNGTNASPTWNRFDNTTPVLPSRWVTRITIDPNNNDIVYVTLGGFSPDNVWRTTNGGTTWTDVTGSGMTGLPDVPVRSLVVNTTDSNKLYVGTEVGIFASEDSGATWSPSNDGPANVSVDELFWMGPKLVAVTHGRGFFTSTPTGGPPAATNPVPANNAAYQATNTTVSWTNGGGATSYDVYFGTVNPPTGAESKGNQAGTTYNPGALAANTTYYWRIDSVNVNGTTTGAVWSFNTNTPAAAINPSPANNAVHQATNTTVSWTNGGGATSYDVYFGTVNPPTGAESKGNQAGTTYNPGALAANTTYYWRIDSVNVNGTTTGAVWSFNTNNSAPIKPTLVSPANMAVNVNKTLVSFTWKPTTDPDGDTVSYELKYCTDAILTTNCVVQIASIPRENVMFAGLGGAGITFLMIGMVAFRNRKNILIQSIALIMLALLLGSCGGSSGSGNGGGGGNTDVVFDDGPLTTATTYYWQVTAKDGLGGSTASDIWSFTTN